MKESRARILSSIILGPVALICIFLGGYFLLFMLILLAFVLSWEWLGLTVNFQKIRASKVSLCTLQGCISSVSAVLLLIPDAIYSSSQLEIISFIFLAASSLALYVLRLPKGMVLGCLYIGLFVQSFIGLLLNTSVLFIFRLITLVWACDIGGYFFGKLFRGPKMCPSISPNKTWIGLMGSFVSAFGFSALLEVTVPWYQHSWSLTPYWSDFYVFSVVVLAILGDLFISTLKRRVGVKNTGKVVPGHGGLLDRFDSFIAVVIFTGLVQFVEVTLYSNA